MRMEMAKIYSRGRQAWRHASWHGGRGTFGIAERYRHSVPRCQEVLRHRGVCRGYGRSLAAASCDCGSGEVHQSGACNFQAETLWQGRGPVHVLQVSHHENRHASEHTDACNAGGQGRHDSYRCHAEESLHRRAAATREHSEGRPKVTAPKKGGVGYLVAKRVFDIVFSAGVCLVLAVPVAVACVAICVDTPGKPFFRQGRIGQGGKKIYIFKLRTMVSDAHDHPERYMSSAQLETWRREQKLDDDPRITRVGRILRRTSLDELPQFLNVLSGDLSVIGPRPVTLAETYEYGDAREEVLSCKPGITGWWAVTDRNNSTWQSGQRQARELFYVRHQSLGLDARVLVKTFKAMRRGR